MTKIRIFASHKNSHDFPRKNLLVPPLYSEPAVIVMVNNRSQPLLSFYMLKATIHSMSTVTPLTSRTYQITSIGIPHDKTPVVIF